MKWSLLGYFWEWEEVKEATGYNNCLPKNNNNLLSQDKSMENFNVHCLKRPSPGYFSLTLLPSFVLVQTIA